MGTVLSFPNKRYLTGYGTTAIISFLTLAAVAYVRRREKITAIENRVIFITGCDSGLGYSFALHAHKLGFIVIAGCLNVHGEGAQQLQNLCLERLHIIQLDVTNTTSIESAVQSVETILKENPKFQFHTLMNNAGVMIFGDFEWQTEKNILSQVNVNLIGTLRVTKGFAPILRRDKVISHCALATLPTLSVYGATKAGLAAWCDGLRIEEAKYGVTVITFIPGSFVHQSKIMSQQREYFKEMEEAMAPEDRHIFDKHLRIFSEYLSGITVPQELSPVCDKKLYSEFEDAILSKHPYPHYKHGPFRYQYYHFLFRISPTWLRDYFVMRFLNFPSAK
ncbi:D-beta-hydroxybutyrate dehydrogenase, mitochondrial-like isoform X2 [Periplaneta americana]|uniref:D-beta-hydroxybutyrate dehydrogenase, mitochondrial-like isoform X2 n=1 Tax=Periplaneta americana TaxID=6978 RepID=UPI0037E82CC2